MLYEAIMLCLLLGVLVVDILRLSRAQTKDDKCPETQQSTEAETEKLSIILQNIERYDGTESGQKEVD